MSQTSSSRPTIAFFGSTGGTTAGLLAQCLKSGHHCTALARTPSKLETLLTSEAHSVPDSTLKSQLQIVKGSITDAEAVQTVLRGPQGTIGGCVDIVFSGIGGTPAMKWSITTPITLTDPHICETAMRSIVAGIESLELGSNGKKPFVSTISTTGVSEKKRDVPYSMYAAYHYALRVPHEDKKKMENVLIAASSSIVDGYTIVRPTLLFDGPKGTKAIKVGWEWGVPAKEVGGVTEPGPQLGYAINRVDVAAWMFEELVQREGGRKEWGGKCVSLTF